MTRIAIAGCPRSGKTTLGQSIASELGIPLRSTDDLITGNDWSAASAAAATWFDEPGDVVIEGVAVSRALRKWHESNPNSPPPFDLVLFLSSPMQDLTPGQLAMGRGCATVHRELVDWLGVRGLEVVDAKTFQISRFLP